VTVEPNTIWRVRVLFGSFNLIVGFGSGLGCQTLGSFGSVWNDFRMEFEFNVFVVGSVQFPSILLYVQAEMSLCSVLALMPIVLRTPSVSVYRTARSIWGFSCSLCP